MGPGAPMCCWDVHGHSLALLLTAAPCAPEELTALFTEKGRVHLIEGQRKPLQMRVGEGLSGQGAGGSWRGVPRSRRWAPCLGRIHPRPPSHVEPHCIPSVEVAVRGRCCHVGGHSWGLWGCPSVRGQDKSTKRITDPRGRAARYFAPLRHLPLTPELLLLPKELSRGRGSLFSRPLIRGHVGL